MSQEQDKINKEFLVATYNGDYDRVQMLLNAGANVNATDNSGYTALIYAADKGDKDVVQMLLNAGANVNATGEDGSTALILAADKGHLEIVSSLLGRPGIDMNAKENVNGSTALMVATDKGYTDVVKMLLNAGANVNATDNSGYTALIYAADQRYTDVVKMLLNAGANVNALDNEYGYTALIVAALHGYTDVVELLLDKGADVNATGEDGSTALMVATDKGYTAIVELLLAVPGIDINAKNKNGRTALIVAALYGRIDVVELLLAEPGIDVNAKDKDGNTALMVAALHGYTEIVNVIRTWGPGVYFVTGDIPGDSRSATNIERLTLKKQNTLPFPPYMNNVRRRADSLDDGELSGNERVLLMLDKLGNNQRGDEEFPDERVDTELDIIRATDHVRSFLGRRDQGQLASVARRFNDPGLPYIDEDPPYHLRAGTWDGGLPYAYPYLDYRNHLTAEAAAGAAAGIDPDVYNFMVSLDFLDFDPLNRLPTDEEVGDAIARQYLLEGDMLNDRTPVLPNAISNVTNRRLEEFGGFWGDAARAARGALEDGEDPEYIRNLVDAMIETFPDDGESKEPVPDQESK